MRNYDVLLFDLDGTLTASGEGITKSVQYALQKMGKGELGQDLETLKFYRAAAFKAVYGFWWMERSRGRTGSEILPGALHSNRDF